MLFFVADVEIQNTDNSDNLNSFFHLNHHHHHQPMFDKQNAMLMPFGDKSDDDDDDLMHLYQYGMQAKSTPRNRALSTHSDTTAVPRIVITPTPEDDEKRRASWAFCDDADRKTSRPFETFELLSSKLSQFYATNAELNPNQNETLNTESVDQNDAKIVTNSQELDDSSQSEKDSDSESESESESQSEEANLEQSDERNFEPPEARCTRNGRLYEMNDIHNMADHESDDDSADIIEFIIDNSCEQTSNCDTIEFNDHLSVIFEEDERSQQSKRVPLESMYSSNSSATLENDSSGKHFDSEEECESDKTYSDNNGNGRSDDDYSDDDDQSTSVTVRLPLRLSFSRSDNDEEITTVMVGKSEIKVDDIIDSGNKTPTVRRDSSPDVSVSICLRPKNRPSSICTQSSIDASNNNKSFDCDEDSDAEVSVSISLPLRQRTKSPPPSPLLPVSRVRPTFTRQHTLSPVPRSRDEFEYKVWNRGFSIERESSIAKSIKPQKPAEPDEMMSLHDRIAAFESFSPVKKQELQRQNACDASFNGTQTGDLQRKNNVEISDQQTYENLPQSIEYREYCDKNDKLITEPNTPNYESFVTSQCNTYNLQPEPAPQYFKMEIEESEDDEEEEDYKANLSVQQKIAAFEQPSTNTLPTPNARQEIGMTRETNEKESIGNRFLAKIADTQATHANEGTKPNKLNCMYLLPCEESELDETDSGVDIQRRVSEDVDTESECYSELRKLTRYERAATHSRLFKILQEYEHELNGATEKSKAEDEMLLSVCRPRKIVHNVSITRRQNPELAKQAETMADRRERLHLNYNSSSIDNDNASSSASPSCASPTSMVSVNEKLIDELVHSVLQQTKRRNLQNIPIEKIQAAARRALIQQHEENDSCDTYSSFDSTPALTPHEFNDDGEDSDCDRQNDILPSKAFKHLQEQSISGRRYKSWAARCPRVLSSKTVNSDLSRVTETRESQTPEREHQYMYQY